MFLYESPFLQLQMQIPDGWVVRSWPDEPVEELFHACESGEPAPSGGACTGALVPLLFAYLYAPGSNATNDGFIELSACSESFFQSGTSDDTKTWVINGMEIEYVDSVTDRSPETTCFRFPRWQVGPGFWLYARIRATGKRRFDYVLSVFETLGPIGCSTAPGQTALFETQPWSNPPTFFRLMKAIDENRPLFDLKLETDLSDKELSNNQEVLNGSLPAEQWTVMEMCRKSRVRSVDCYYGPQGLYCLGVFSLRTAEVLRPYYHQHFSELPCQVNGKPFFFLVPKQTANSCFDEANSQIKRFENGDIMSITRYRFRKDLVPDPLVFAIPEDRTAILTTASIPEIIEQAALTGIALYPVDGNGREFTCPG